MFDQATVEQQTETQSATGTKLTDVLHDMTELSELQVRLLVADSRELLAGSKQSIIGLLAAVALGMGSVPVAMFGMAHAIATTGWLSTPAALLLVGFTGIVPALLLVWLSATRLQHSLASLNRSASEFTRNLQWFKSALKRQPR